MLRTNLMVNRLMLVAVGAALFTFVGAWRTLDCVAQENNAPPSSPGRKRPWPSYALRRRSRNRGRRNFFKQCEILLGSEKSPTTQSKSKEKGLHFFDSDLSMGRGQDIAILQNLSARFFALSHLCFCQHYYGPIEPQTTRESSSSV